MTDTDCTALLLNAFFNSLLTFKNTHWGFVQIIEHWILIKTLSSDSENDLKTNNYDHREYEAFLPALLPQFWLCHVAIALPAAPCRITQTTQASSNTENNYGGVLHEMVQFNPQSCNFTKISFSNASKIFYIEKSTKQLLNGDLNRLVLARL